MRKTRFIGYAIYLFLVLYLFGCYYVEDIPKPTLSECDALECNLKSECYRCYALENNNPAYCETADILKDQCYYDLALKKRDGGICKRAGKDNEICYNDVAMLTRNINLCENAGLQKGFCKTNVERVIDNYDFCVRMGGGESACAEDELTHRIKMPDESMCADVTAIEKNCIEAGLKQVFR